MKESKFTFIEDVLDRETIILRRVYWLIVVNALPCPFLLTPESVAIPSGYLSKFVNELLLDTHRVVGPCCVDLPLEAVLFGVVLGHEERIVEGLDSRNKLHSVFSKAS